MLLIEASNLLQILPLSIIFVAPIATMPNQENDSASARPLREFPYRALIEMKVNASDGKGRAS